MWRVGLTVQINVCVMISLAYSVAVVSVCIFGISSKSPAIKWIATLEA